MEQAPAMLAAGARVVDLSGAFRLRTPERYLAGHCELVKKGLDELRKLLPEDDIQPGNPKGSSMIMSPGFITGPGFSALIDPSAQVAVNAEFSGCVVVGARSRIGGTARLTDSVILENGFVGEGSDLDRVILGIGIQAPPHTRLFRCTIGKGDAAIKVPGTSQRSWQGNILRPLSN